MGLWIRLAIRNALRNSRRTLLTASTIVVATALITVTLAYIQGVFGGMVRETVAVVGHIRVVDAEFARREAMAPMDANIADAKPVLAAIRKVPGVVDVYARIVTGAVITAGDELGDNFTAVTGASDDYYRGHLKGPEKLAEGRWLKPKGPEVVVGRKLAAKINAKLGDKILLMGRTQYDSMSPLNLELVGVAGGDAVLDNSCFISLQQARWMADMEGGALEVVAYAADEKAATVEPVAAAIAALPEAKGLDVKAWHQREPWNMMGGLMEGMELFIELLVVFMAALAIFNTMMMSVLERSAEIGVLRAMGLTGGGTVGLFLVEASFVGLLGGIGGTALGSIGGWLLQTKGITLGDEVIDKMGSGFPISATLYGEMTWSIVATSLVFGFIIALVGAALPAIRAAAIQPVTAMRART